MSNELKEIINKLKDAKTYVKTDELLDYVIAIQLEQVIRLDALPELQVDATANLIDLLRLRMGV